MHLGDVDFNRTCEDRNGSRVFKVSDILVPYFICNECGFIFTNFFDDWTSKDFKEKLYNEEYELADPKDNSQGEKQNSGYTYGKFFSHLIDGLILDKKINKKKKDIKILDYGSGCKLSSFGLGLQNSGFHIDSYDPYYLKNQTFRKNKYDFIFMIEVIEHCHNLEETGNTLNNLLSKNGQLWIQTGLHETNNQNILSGSLHFWTAPKKKIIDFSWYIAPRNGHVSIFSFRAIQFYLNRFNMKLFKFDEKSGILQNLILAQKNIN